MGGDGLMRHFVFVPLEDGNWLFQLKRDRELAFGVYTKTGKAITIEGMTHTWTADEWIEAMKIHGEILAGTFDHPAIDQFNKG